MTTPGGSEGLTVVPTKIYTFIVCTVKMMNDIKRGNR